MPLALTLILGVAGWGVIRAFTVAWPQLTEVRRAIWSLVFMTLLGRLAVVLIIVLAAIDSLIRLSVARDVVLAASPIVGIALGLELVWRGGAYWLARGTEIRWAPRTPWTETTPRWRPSPPTTTEYLRRSAPSAAAPPRSVPRTQPAPVAATPAAVLTAEAHARRLPQMRLYAATTQPLAAGAPAAALRSRAHARPLPQMRMYGALPEQSVAATSQRFARNEALILAVLAAIAQGVLAIINGVNALHAKAGGTGVITIAIGALVIVAAGAVLRPSYAARWLLILWEVVAALFTVGFLVHARDVAQPVVSAAGAGVVHPAIALAISAVVLYGLLLHPATREAFGR